ISSYQSLPIGSCLLSKRLTILEKWYELTRRETMRQNTANYEPLPVFTAPIRSFIHLERASGSPLYRQICDGLREAILSGELAEGTRLPTERALAQELGLNRTTVMNAYNELASEGLVERHVGRGTLVRRSYFDLADEDFD